MNRLVLIVLALAIMVGCGPPTKYHDIRDQEPPPQEEPLKFSNDPLLDSIMWSRYQDCLRNCSDDKKCRKDCCD